MLQKKEFTGKIMAKYLVFFITLAVAAVALGQFDALSQHPQLQDVAISGVVLNVESSPLQGVPNASVLITQNDIELWSKVTDSEGRYSFLSVPAGSYVITATKSDFRLSHSRNITVGSSPLTVNFLLSPYRYGDVNHDGLINDADLLLIINAWQTSRTKPGGRFIPEADLDYSDSVNSLDVFEMANRWFRAPVPNTPTPTPLVSDTPTETPVGTEIPTTMATDTPTDTYTPTFTITSTWTVTATATETTFQSPEFNP